MSNVMLESLYIHNFKSFYKSKFEFGKLNCLIAPNNSGKSNLTSVLKFLNDLLYKNTTIAIANIGIDNIKNYHYEENEININASFKVKNKVLIDNELIDYSLTFLFLFVLDFKTKKTSIDIVIKGKIKSIEIDSADLTDGFGLRIIGKLESSIENYHYYNDELNKKTYRSFDFSYNNNTLFYNISTRHDSTQEIIKKLFALNVSKGDDERLDRPLTFSFIFCKNHLFSGYYFQTHEIKRPGEYGVNYLVESGQNLPEYLAYLYKNDKTIFDEISISLIGEVALVNSISVYNESIPTLVFKEELNDKVYPVSIREISDGTLHYLAIMSAIQGDKVSQALIFEEPERHMHMKVLSTILNTMRDDDKQMFFTTHSTEILQQLKLDEILFMFRDYDGDTKGKRAKDIPNIKKIMKIYKDDIVEMIKIGILDDLGDA
ncbi:MAG: ATP-binding protein [Campylobacterota bacterium]|nr:ATP-binding protein [Campylobacterota bacterium]